MNRSFRLAVLILVTAVLAAPCSTAQSGWAFQGIIPGGHRGAVSALIYEGEKILSAGEDGFLEIWNTRTGAAEERIQLSPYRINTMVQRPGKPEICLIESDGLGLYRISAWNYQERENLFTLRFRDPISYIAYSAGGNFLIAARSGRTGLVFIHPETGEVLQSPRDLTGIAGFAATGRSERNMIVYFSGGVLSYWDLVSGNETGRFQIPPNITSPIIFGNNRFFAGIDAEGLVILDAVSGTVLARDSSVPRGSVLSAGAGGTEFVCLAANGDPEVYRFAVDAGRLLVRERRSLPRELSAVTMAAFNNGAVLGTEDGGVWLMDQGEPPRNMTVKNQRKIVEAAASGPDLAFITEDGYHGFLPLEYFRLTFSDLIKLEQNGGYIRIAPFSGEGGGFLLWQGEHTRLYPMIRPAGDGGSSFVLQSLPFRFPLRAAAVFGEKTLFLDSAGNISVITVDTAAKTGNLAFSFSSIGSMDAAFVDGDNIILGRSAVSGNSPFLLINLVTGETVPLAYPSSVGVRVYRGASGAVYGAAVDEEGGALRTSIIKLDTKNPSQSVRMVEYQGEDTLFSVAETAGTLASTLGAEGAALFSSRGMRNFERSPGLPFRLFEGGPFFVTVDGDGNICWYDPRTGKLLALFRLYENEWILQHDQGESLWGAVQHP
ncbi:MAG: WD40 repeat domain-containing protein [Treponema sp.]|jgi:hypothetical protein|nr:WD40 repeat domain-containing protein [Treponema sp.]